MRRLPHRAGPRRQRVEHHAAHRVLLELARGHHRERARRCLDVVAIDPDRRELLADRDRAGVALGMTAERRELAIELVPRQVARVAGDALHRLGVQRDDLVQMPPRLARGQLARQVHELRRSDHALPIAGRATPRLVADVARGVVGQVAQEAQAPQRPARVRRQPRRRHRLLAIRRRGAQPVEVAEERRRVGDDVREQRRGQRGRAVAEQPARQPRRVGDRQRHRLGRPPPHHRGPHRRRRLDAAREQARGEGQARRRRAGRDHRMVRRGELARHRIGLAGVRVPARDQRRRERLGVMPREPAPQPLARSRQRHRQVPRHRRR